MIPRGDGPQYVSGHLYIIEGLWCIYSLDIRINEQLGATIQLNQSFGEVRDGAWLPVNNRYKIDMDLMEMRVDFFIPPLSGTINF